MCVVSAPLMVFGIDRQGKIDAVHTIVLVDDQGRVAPQSRSMADDDQLEIPAFLRRQVK